MSGLRWTRKTTAKIAADLQTLGVSVSARTVARLLKQMGYSLRVNTKARSAASPQDRNAQFERIGELREHCAARTLPIISVDTKKKELVGIFKNPGAAWSREAIRINDHDFRSDAIGFAVPYGIYDLRANRGTGFVGTSRDTPKFAVDFIEKRWRTEGQNVIQIREVWPSWPMAEEATDLGAERGNTAYNTNSAIATASRSPSLTISRVRQR